MVKHLRSGTGGVIVIIIFMLIALGVGGYFLYKSESKKMNGASTEVQTEENISPTAGINKPSGSMTQNESTSSSAIDTKLNDLNNSSASIDQGMNDAPIDVTQ